MRTRYEHTQTGYVIIFSLLLAGLVIYLVSVAVSPVPRGVFLVPTAILLICLALFYSLTVSIEDNHLKLRFGIGIIRKTFPLREIVSCEPVRNSWLCGWGIHYTPHGWLFNVSGLHAVQIRMKNGKSYRIGTDEPAALAKAIQEAIAERS